MSLRSRLVHGFQCRQHPSDPYTEGFCGACLDDHLAGVIPCRDERPAGGWVSRARENNLPTFSTHQGAHAYRQAR